MLSILFGTSMWSKCAAYLQWAGAAFLLFAVLDFKFSHFTILMFLVTGVIGLLAGFVLMFVGDEPAGPVFATASLIATVLFALCLLFLVPKQRNLPKDDAP